MFSFFLNLARLLMAVRQGIKEDKEIRALLLLLLTLLAGATVLYSRLEGWRIIRRKSFLIF